MNGITKLSWQEIDAWISACQMEESVQWKEIDHGVFQPITIKHPKLLPWEIEVIRFMSEEYAGEYHEASDINRPAPYGDNEDGTEFARQMVPIKLKAHFNAQIAKAQPAAEPNYTVEE